MLTASTPTVAKITRVVSENYRTKTFEFNLSLSAHPGQFVMVWLPRFDEKPFSLVYHDPVTLMVTAVGPFSSLLHQLDVGEPVWIRGPFGRGFQIEAHHRQIALVGGGYGVAPLYWLARCPGSQTETIVSIVGARQKEDLLYRDRFADLVTQSEELDPARAQPRYELHIATEDGSLGSRGRVTNLLEPMLADGQIDGLYACGPDGMLRALEHLAVRYGIDGQLSWEAYMRCALGICGSCEHRGEVLCMDGPVLRIGK